MAIERRVNYLSQQRIDSPDMKSVESAVSNDFDKLIQAFVTGTNQGYILRGFEISMAGAIGGAASGLQLTVDPGAVLHIASSVSGTIFMVPSGSPAQVLNSATNNIVDGAFSPSAINYIGLEYERFIDSTTSSQVYLWDPTSNTETTKNAPRAQVLRYRIKITTTSFAANVLPIAAVLTDSGNNVQQITDARYLLFRLGTGGSSPNPFYSYPWSEGRVESPSSSTSPSVNPFFGGDKAISSLKDWMNAVMTAIQEVKGTTYWYSQGASGSLEVLREDLGNTVITGAGSISHGELPTGTYAPTLPGQINWDQDIFLSVVGSRLEYKILANPSAANVLLADGQAAYVNLTRGVEVSPNLVFTNGSAVVPSVGGIAWAGPLQAGDYVKLGSDTDAGYYQIASVHPSLTQVTLTIPFAGISTGPAGAKADYAFGTYQSALIPSTDRDIYIVDRENVPAGDSIFWLFFRDDHGGSIPRVYIRFLGAELEDQESEDISSNQSKDTLQYIGAPLASTNSPLYVEMLVPGALPEISDITVGNAASITSNQYFLINSSNDARKYFVWFNKDGTGTEPNVPYTNASVEVAITTGDSAADVAAALHAAIVATISEDFLAPVPVAATVTVTNSSAGTCVAASNFNVGAPFAIAQIQAGIGVGNNAIKDNDNLTLAIKELDKYIGDLVAALDTPAYDQTVDIVTAGATPPTSLNGPVLSGSLITLPNNVRLGSIAQKYTVGRGILQVSLNGQRLVSQDDGGAVADWAEYGAPGSRSDQIQILQDLAIGDTLKFEIIAVGGSGSGGGTMGPPGPTGLQGPPGLDAVDPLNIATKVSDYPVLLTDKILLADASSIAITFTLPPASTAAGRLFFFKKIDVTANAMTILCSGIDVIDGVGSHSTTTQYASFTIACDGTSYWIL